MNLDLINFIRHLSVNDKKSLTQKALKTTEEVGELAKAILPFENAAGTLHRFTDRNKILENVADVYLSAISIAYGMEFTDEEIESMIHRKSRKWSMLQTNEADVKFPLPYEIHITVERPDNIDLFKHVCNKIGVKPIIIELEKDGDTVMSDVMTSSVHFGDNQSAVQEAQRIFIELTNPHEYFVNENDTSTDWKSFKVLRTKIETVPWHPAAPSMKNDLKMEKSNYFESHLRIVTTIERRPILDEIADQYNAHLSRNFFKKLNDSEYIIMMTLRRYDVVSEVFQAKVNALKEVLESYSFEVDKVEIEFAIYDSNDTHDKVWING